MLGMHKEFGSRSALGERVRPELGMNPLLIAQLTHGSQTVASFFASRG